MHHLIAQDTIKTVSVADLAPTRNDGGDARSKLQAQARWREEIKPSGSRLPEQTTHSRLLWAQIARQYLIDRHHLVLALRDEEGIGEALSLGRRQPACAQFRRILGKA